MRPEDYALAVRRETNALADAVASAPDAKVPSCPDWTLTHLGEHIAEVQRFWLDVVTGRRARRADVVPAVRPDGTGLVKWIRDGAALLADALRTGDPGTPVWTWARDQSLGFVQRRQAQEAAVHRWDAQNAAGSPVPIEASLAADGLDEFFEIILTHNKTPLLAEGNSFAVVPEDHGDPWRAEAGPDGIVAARGRNDAACVARGRASDLLLMLWRRLPEEVVAIEGDTSVLIRLMTALDLD